jgi:hypothetical protein
MVSHVEKKRPLFMRMPLPASFGLHATNSDRPNRISQS